MELAFLTVIGVITLICVVALYISWTMVKHNKDLKK